MLLVGSSLVVYKAKFPSLDLQRQEPSKRLIQHRARLLNGEILVYLKSGERREGSNKPSLKVKVGGRTKGSSG